MSENFLKKKKMSEIVDYWC